MLPWLCHHFNESSCMFKIDMLKEFSVSSYDVEDIFLLPHVTESKVSFQLRKQPLSNLLIQKEWKKKLGIPEDDEIIVNNLENKLKSLKEGWEDFKRFFVMYVCSTFLALVANRVIDYKEFDTDNQREKDAENQGVDDDISKVVHSVTESILNHPTFTKEATKKTIEDCGEKDVDIDFVSKTMKGNKSRRNEMPELFQVVVDYCFVKYSPFKHEEIGKFESLLMITRDDTISLAPTAPAQMIKSNIVQSWSFLMNDSRLKEDPSCFFFGIDHSTIQYLDNREYDDRHKPFYRILGSIVVEEMSNFLKRINHEKADEILEYEFDEVNFKWKTPRYTLDCGVFAMIHMLCFSGETFDSDLDLANRRKVYRAEICATHALADINTKRKQLQRKISRFRVVRKLEKEKGVEDMICVSDFLKKHKEVMDNMSLQCYQVIDYLAINDGENFPNKSEVVGWFIDSIEIVRQDCNTLLNEWKVTSNVITAWSNHLNNIEMEKDRSENDFVRYFFGFDFMIVGAVRQGNASPGLLNKASEFLGKAKHQITKSQFSL
uniref:Ubiquitin-like protease family profile domain-containing protein n=1 Tax=Chenopodium quinoa TaxID=63459 RepID=A0A803MDT4_CHEQI